MHISQGQVDTVLFDERGSKIAWLRCEKKAVPAPGRYLMAWKITDRDASLAVPLFASAYDETGFLAIASAPISWEPGDLLQLRGPLGHGFAIPPMARKLALGAFSGQAARLLPLIIDGLSRDLAVALFLDGPLPHLPTAVEIHPLSAWQDALSWADFLALDLPLDELSQVVQILGMQANFAYGGPAGQALVLADMPCGGLADCGVCSISAGRNWKLVCVDGPVLDFDVLGKLSG